MKNNISLYLLLLLFISGCSQPTLFKETRILMDTFAEISVFSPDKKIALKAMREAFGEMERVEKAFSKFDKKSEVSKVNRLAGIEKVRISPELFKVIEDSIYYSRLSKGSFDITVAPLTNIWTNACKRKSIPDVEVINEALKHVGYENIKLDEKALTIRFLDKDLKVDLGGIAKGYAVDRAKEVLLSYGIESALIDIGGNIFALGNPPGRKTWNIGIKHPRDKRDIIYKLNLKNQAVSTSGDYERFFTLNGKRFSHIINPVNGRPAEGIMSVTVVTDSAEKADALSTAVFVMGVEDALKFVRSLEGIEIFIVDNNENLIKYP